MFETRARLSAPDNEQSLVAKQLLSERGSHIWVELSKEFQAGNMGFFFFFFFFFGPGFQKEAQRRESAQQFVICCCEWRCVRGEAIGGDQILTNKYSNGLLFCHRVQVKERIS